MGCDALADCSFRPSATAFFQLRTVEGLKNSSPSANVTESEVRGITLPPPVSEESDCDGTPQKQSLPEDVYAAFA